MQRRQTLQGDRLLSQDLLAPPPDHGQDVHSQGVGPGGIGRSQDVQTGDEAGVDSGGEERIAAQRLELRGERRFLVGDGGVVLLE